eukprot:TRINITY_DN920_c0_g2_i1.p1 TRINITY_DN920_c0_g2~~TRINITY_DN920_c0_g2_i1.p1  ORF type:complete len:821 (-),score=287.32 TRINITY_DN920_c0_g2_i1:81-2543(-)
MGDVQGWLFKRGEKGLVKGWKERYFKTSIASQPPVILYAADGDKINNPSTVLGTIDLRSITGVSANDSLLSSFKRGATYRGFEIKTNLGRVYYLIAPDDKELEKWTTFINNNVDSKLSEIVNPFFSDNSVKADLRVSAGPESRTSLSDSNPDISITIQKDLEAKMKSDREKLEQEKREFEQQKSSFEKDKLLLQQEQQSLNLEKQSISQDKSSLDQGKLQLEELQQSFNKEKQSFDAEKETFIQNKKIFESEKASSISTTTTHENNNNNNDQERENFQQQLKQFEVEKQNLQKDRDSYENDKKLLDQQLESIEKEKKSLEAERLELNQQKQKLESDKEFMELEQQRLQQQKQSFEQDKQSHEHDQQSSLETEKKKLEEVNSLLQLQQQSLEKDKQSFEKEKQSLEQERSILQQQRQQLEQDKQSSKQHQQQQQHSDDHLKNLLVEKDKIIEAIQKQSNELKIQLLSLQDEYDDLQLQFDDTSNQLNDANTLLKLNQSQSELLDQQIKELNEKLSQQPQPQSQSQSQPQPQQKNITTNTTSAPTSKSSSNKQNNNQDGSVDAASPIDVVELSRDLTELTKQYNEIKYENLRLIEENEFHQYKTLDLNDLNQKLLKSIETKDEQLLLLQNDMKELREQMNSQQQTYVDLDDNVPPSPSDVNSSQPRAVKTRRLLTAINAHQSQNAILIQSIEKIEKDKKVIVNGKEKMITFYKNDSEHWQNQYNQLIKKVLLKQNLTEEINHHARQLANKLNGSDMASITVAELDELKQSYFHSLLIGIKMNLALHGKVVNINNVDQLYNEADKKMEWRQWKEWLLQQIKRR